ncbi:hypothetical protein CCMSSC00406_0004300 [Pleurotus cornucopiae]|uniref:Uncharacterized protein n=1 Tax=Pleurotus cornucopiae TaxID=5321 RepID=A0ACB7JAY2_PLECO|nr:hypothetical protein CCMSSC00406_0004300 [Pleurotus cornucopiae]
MPSTSTQLLRTGDVAVRDAPKAPNPLNIYSAAGTPVDPATTSTPKFNVLEAPAVSLSLSDMLTPADFASVFDICASVEKTIASLDNYASSARASRDIYTPNTSLAPATSDSRPITLLLLGPRPSTPAIQLHACHADANTMNAFRESRAEDRSWPRGVPSCNVPDDVKASREAATPCMDLALLHAHYRRQFQPESLPPVQKQAHAAVRNVRGGVISAAIRAASQGQGQKRPLLRHECVIRVEVGRTPRDGPSAKKGVRACFQSLYRESMFHERMRRVAGYASDVMSQGRSALGRGSGRGGRGGPGNQRERTPSNEVSSNVV